jgi:hypothetical protein
MSFRLAIVALSISPLVLAGQPKSKSQPNAAADERPVPAGYKGMTMSGFEVNVSFKVVGQNDQSVLAKKPLDVLKSELKRVMEVVPKAALAELQKVPIWVEWDDIIQMGNGRGGNALAVYQGGHQQNLVDPKKNRAVTILSLESLAKEHQPGSDSGRCVVLHELAHAYHDLVINGSQDPKKPAKPVSPEEQKKRGQIQMELKSAYQAARERNRYDAVLYAATNEHEYFAELTCCYLQGLDYPPRTRAELFQRDPPGHKLMKLVWGDSADASAKPNPRGLVSRAIRLARLSSTTDNVTLGDEVVGKIPDKAKWKGRPVVIAHFVADDPVSGLLLKRLNDDLFTDLKDLLTVIGAEYGKAEPGVVKTVKDQRGLTFPIVEKADLGLFDGYSFPHAVVYDHTGQCIFRGHPLDAIPYARKAAGEAILASLGNPVTTKSAQVVAKLLKDGAPLRDVLTKIKNLTDSTLPPADQKELQELREKLTGPARAIFDEISGSKTKDPVAAYYEAKRIAETYRNAPIAKDASDLVVELNDHNPAVEWERTAGTKLDAIAKLEMDLRTKEYSFDPRNPEFQAKNKPLLFGLTSKLRELRDTYTGTRPAKEALLIAQRWALDLDAVPKPKPKR